MVLKKGDKSIFVQGLQEILNKLGYSCDINSVFDIKTYNALIKFQIKNKLPLTGIFDDEIQQIFLINLININSIPLSSYQPSSIILNKSISSWIDDGWFYVLRAKKQELNTQIVKLNQLQLNNLEFICYLIGLPELFILNKDKKYIEDIKNNFFIFDTYNYTHKPDYLKKGDILISKNNISIVIADGIKAGQIATTEIIAKNQKVRSISKKKINIRYKPSLESAIVSQFDPGATFTILEEKNGWGRLKSGLGWVNLKFVEKL